MPKIPSSFGDHHSHYQYRHQGEICTLTLRSVTRPNDRMVREIPSGLGIYIRYGDIKRAGQEGMIVSDELDFEHRWIVVGEPDNWYEILSFYWEIARGTSVNQTINLGDNRTEAQKHQDEIDAVLGQFAGLSPEPKYDPWIREFAGLPPEPESPNPLETAAEKATGRIVKVVKGRDAPTHKCVMRDPSAPELVDRLVAAMADAGFLPEDLVALVKSVDADAVLAEERARRSAAGVPMTHDGVPGDLGPAHPLLDANTSVPALPAGQDFLRLIGGDGVSTGKGPDLVSPLVEVGSGYLSHGVNSQELSQGLFPDYIKQANPGKDIGFELDGPIAGGDVPGT